MSYAQGAVVYDAIYTAMKDYGQEAERLHELIRQHKATSGNRLLDVACGTGLHDQYLRQWYEVEGLDLDADMLARARQRLPEMTFYQKDMVTFDLPQSYDVITCLFSAIGHLTELEYLQQAIANMARHLVPGGVLLIEPWLLQGMWQPGYVSTDTGSTADFRVVRMGRSELKGRITHLEMHHLVGYPDRIEHFVEEHDTALYSEEEYLLAFRLAGLEAWRDEQGINRNGRGIFIGLKALP